jgi:NAD(P)-dependent dehydrogenase (short-subunit alcohol dehydrogenase family)
VIIIVGASGDIGRYLASRFCDYDFEVCAIDRIPFGNKSSINLQSVIVDFSDLEAIDSLWRMLNPGPNSTLINLLGEISTDPILEPLMGTDSSDLIRSFERAFKQSFFPIVHATMSFSRHVFQNSLKAQVINFGSISSYGVFGQIPYGSAKGAVQSFSRTASVELGAYGVRINCVLPGYVDSPNLASRISGARLEEVIRSSSVRQLVSLEDVFLATKFLNDSETITGAVIEVHSSYGK